MENLKEKTTEQLEKEIENKILFFYNDILNMLDIIQELKERE